jgi:hypothetical protein
VEFHISKKLKVTHFLPNFFDPYWLFTFHHCKFLNSLFFKNSLPHDVEFFQ